MRPSSFSRNVTCLPCAGNAVAPFSARNFIDISLTCSNVILNSNLFQNNLHSIPHSTNLLKISPLAAFQKSHMNCKLSLDFVKVLRTAIILIVSWGLSFHSISPNPFHIMSESQKPGAAAGHGHSPFLQRQR